VYIEASLYLANRKDKKFCAIHGKSNQHGFGSSSVIAEFGMLDKCLCDAGYLCSICFARKAKEIYIMPANTSMPLRCEPHPKEVPLGYALIKGVLEALKTTY
jgi:hypothetical protein